MNEYTRGLHVGDLVVRKGGSGTMRRVVKVERKFNYQVNIDLAYGQELEALIHTRRVAIVGGSLVVTEDDMVFCASTLTKVTIEWVEQRIAAIEAQAAIRIASLRLIQMRVPEERCALPREVS